MIRKIGEVLGIGLLLLSVCLTPALGQSGGKGERDEYYNRLGDLNVWTTEEVLRGKFGYSPELLTMRFGKHRGYDRAVFEFDSELIGYYITYGKPPFQGQASEREVRVRGNAFVDISLYPIKASDQTLEANDHVAARQSKVDMPLIREVKSVEWFEAELRYVIGLRRKRPFRVQVFSNPTRLVVDFKH